MKVYNISYLKLNVNGFFFSKKVSIKIGYFRYNKNGIIYQSEVNEMINIGDILFQLFGILVLVFFIAIIVFVARSSKKRKDQLDRIEEKLDRVLRQIPKE